MEYSYKTLHNISKTAERDPQKAMDMLAKRNSFALTAGIASATSRGGFLINHRIDHLQGLQKWTRNELKFDQSHHNSGMVDQDRKLVKAVSDYSKSHVPSEWTDIDLDYDNDDYPLKPVTADSVSDITFAMLND